MQTGAPPARRRSLFLAAAGILTIVLTGCTGRGGGQLPPQSPVFNGAASFGFSFSCEDSGGLNPPTGQLRIQLSYTERSSSLLTPSFGVHGTADVIDPVLESMLCVGQNPPEPNPNELIFLGRYGLTTSAPSIFPGSCRKSTPTCRFEVTVRDNDMNRAPSTGDFFQISLSSTTAVVTELSPETVFYTRSGVLSSGNLTVD